ncbi:MAG: hypothetical protein ACFFAO_09905 [Candidatus Hermodarchaeota archaeon]
MIMQEFERYDFLETIAQIIGFILGIFRPVVTPLGEAMVFWVDYLLTYFPSDNLTIYIVIFVVLIVSAIIINTKWPGEVIYSVYKDEESETNPEKKDSGINYL